MNDLVENPFGSPAGGDVTASGRAVASRENTEVMALAMMAKKFPRDLIACADRIRNAFARPTLAEKAQYQFARGGTDIVGPSIRAAEAIAQQWGNMSNGWREVSRVVGPDGVGVSEVEAYCTDYESVNRESITFVVRHWRDTKSGGYKLKDERDIYELCANQAQRRKRACILAQIPGDVVEMAMDQAGVTLKAKADTSPEGTKALLETFAALGITKEHIEKRIQRRIESIMPAQVVQLKRIYVSLRDEMSEPGDWFDIEPDAAPAAGLEAVRKATAEKRASKGPKGSGGAQASATGDSAAGGPASPAGATDAATGQVFETLDAVKAKIDKASDGEIAALVLDEARDMLATDDEKAAAVAYYKAKWGAK
jgi:hypothetical protein